VVAESLNTNVALRRLDAARANVPRAHLNVAQRAQEPPARVARHICPSCIQSAQGHAGASELDAHRVRYDSLALALAIVPTIVTPAVSVYLAVRYWSAPMSLVHSSRIRWVLALLASAGQTGFWAWLFLS